MTKENFIKKTIESLEEYLHHEMWRYTEPPLGREECELFLELLREVGKVEKRPTGKWKYKFVCPPVSFCSSSLITCTECDYSRQRVDGEILNYCPNCGAEMKEEE